MSFCLDNAGERCPDPPQGDCCQGLDAELAQAAGEDDGSRYSCARATGGAGSQRYHAFAQDEY